MNRSIKGYMAALLSSNIGTGTNFCVISKGDSSVKWRIKGKFEVFWWHRVERGAVPSGVKVWGTLFKKR